MRRLFCKSLFLAALSFSVVYAQNGDMVHLAMSGTEAYSLVERSDWSRYRNGKYVGHTYHEVRASIVPQKITGSSDLLYQGNFLVLEETLHDMRQSARAINAMAAVRFRLNEKGDITLEEDNGFPTLRRFPLFPSQQIAPGAKWTAWGERAVDPLNTGVPTLAAILVEYEYLGVEDYRETPVHRIKAKFASNGQAAGGDFIRIQGSHEVDILIRVEDGRTVLMRDQLDETFFLTDGSTLRFRGFTLTFTEGLVPLDKAALITVLTQPAPPAKPEPAPAPIGFGEGIDVVEVPEGVRLTIKDVRFVPDSDAFLPEERSRLDVIAAALKQVPDRSFLVEGHTANVGQSASELELSIRRAKRMVDELTQRGIAADRFLYKGWGGAKPLADNTTEAGRSQNRRVEITILE
jgi:outer membrane protein OmpA-like peptidoglycan-associated protein